jgi:sugar phosphate isomerase/epimerase
MVDREGNLAEKDTAARNKAVDNHKKWVDAAKYLGCHSIRVNARGEGSREEQYAQAVDGLSTLSAFAQGAGINVIVENHGGLSSNGSWLSGVIAEVGMDNCGTLPDFGNFCITGNPNGDCSEAYDRYKGVEELMPFAKAVSAKTTTFDDTGNEVNIDYKRLIAIVKKAGYKGYIGIEYEGNHLSEIDGIIATKKLLERYI